MLRQITTKRRPRTLV